MVGPRLCLRKGAQELFHTGMNGFNLIFLKLYALKPVSELRV